MTSADNSQGLSARELQTLLLAGQAMSQEQDEERIYHWVVDAAASLLGARVAAFGVTPVAGRSPRVAYGMSGSASISAVLSREVAKLLRRPWPRSSGRVVTLTSPDVPSGLGRRGVRLLARVDVRTIHHEFGVLLVGRTEPEQLGPGQQFILTTLANHAAVALENARLRRQSQQREERLAGFNRIIRAISSSLALEGVFQLVSWEVNSLLPHNRASVAMADPGGETATVYATAGEEGALGAGNVIPLDGSLVGEVIRSGRGCFKTDFEQEKDFVERRELLTTGIRSNVTVPLWYGEECIGALNFGSFEAGAYGPDHLTLAQEIADQVTVAIINARLYGEAQQLAVSEERNRMAREIHDTLAQGLTGIVLQLEGAEQVAGESIEELEDHLARAKEHARECLREARRSVWNLLPPALEKMSLPAALQDEVRRFSDGGSEQASFKAAGRSRDLSARVQAALLRICQESLTNVRKHAQASQVSVGLTFQADRVLLHVQDNGKGFDPEAPLTPTAQGGFGLRGIRERADELAGQIVVVSDRSGTLVQATIPTGEAAAA